MLPFLDQLSCRHELCGEPNVAETAKLQQLVLGMEGCMGAPGVSRSSLPEDATHSQAQRLELRSRIYPFAPAVEPSNMEQLILVHGFETLLNSTQPERTACLRERTVRERVPANVLIQTLHGAMRSEPFIASAYLPRYDCLLLALYHRAPAGRVVWSSWEHDVPLWEADKQPPKPAEEEKPPEPDPVPDPADKKKGKKEEPKGKKKDDKKKEEPPPVVEEVKEPEGPQVILHEVLRTSSIEKLVTPPDGSIILVSRYQRDRATVTEVVEPEPDPNAPQGEDAVAPTDATAAAAAPPAPAPAAATAAATDTTGAEGAEEGAGAEGEEVPPEPQPELPPLGGWRVARVFKDNLTFGIADDEIWTKLRTEQRDRKEAARAAEAAAKAAAAAAEAAKEAARLEEQAQNDKDAKKKGAKGKKEDKKKEEAALPAEPEEVKEPEPPIPMPYPDKNFGEFWVAFEDGARYTARMQGERVFAAAEAGIELLAASGAPLGEGELPPLGVVVTYTQPSGDTVQVFGDGTVQMCRASAPRRYAGGKDRTSSSAPFERVVQSEASAFQPGCEQDTEVARRVTPFGTVIRHLLSGRIEVYYSDGTMAWRNPTVAELNTSLDSAKASLANTDKYWLDIIERLRNAGRSNETLSSAPSEEEKAFGLPGHWLVVRRDGTVTGRVPCPSRPVDASPDTTAAEQEGEVDPATAPAAATSAEEADPPPPAPPSLEELLDGVVTADGMIEYQAKPVAVSTQVELLSRERTVTNALGLVIFEAPEGSSQQQVCIHSDGTRVTKFNDSMVHITKEGMDHVECRLGSQFSVLVDCADGTRLEITPQNTSCRALDCSLKDDFLRMSTQAAVVLKRKDLTEIKSGGKGEITITTLSDGTRQRRTGQKTAYQAHCMEGSLQCNFKTSSGGVNYKVLSDQSVRIMDPALQVPGVDADMSPRCSEQARPVLAPALEKLEQPWAGSDRAFAPPRLFVVYGDGSAEEFHSREYAEDLLATARNDPEAQVVSSDALESPLQDVICHTILHNRTRPGLAPVQAAAAAAECIQVGSKHQDSSLGNSVPLMPPLPKAPAAGITEHRQLLQFPEITEDMQEKFLGTLKQYREWEQKSLETSRAMAAIVEVKKDKKKKKGEGEGGKKKGKKDKGPTEEELLREAQLKAEQEPKFAPKLKLTSFEHKVRTFALRAAQCPEPSNQELLERATKSLEAGEEGEEATQVEDGEAKVDVAQAVGAENAALETPVETLAAEGLDENQVEDETKLIETSANADGEPQLEGTEAEPTEAEPGKSGAEGTSDDPAVVAESPQQPPKKKRQPKILVQAPTFSYFKSDMGLQFLDETGTLDRPPIQKKKGKAGKADAGARRDPWNPRLVGEAEPEEEEPPADETQSKLLAEDALETQLLADEDQSAPQQNFAGEDEGLDPEEEGNQFAEAADTAMQMQDTQRQDMPSGYPQAALPIAPVRHETPSGPHPDKRGSQWNIKGEVRKQNPAVGQAYTAVNASYLEVEGATDRRVRTVSVAHKKNAGKAPSVQLVRKQGVHTVGRGPEMAAHQILERQAGTENTEDVWRLSSTMQGLGDANNLVEVKPGSCRFGPLRAGSVYRMTVYFRNLDVDVTRFNVAPVNDPMVSLQYTPGHLAPGIATKLVVEVRAITPQRVEQLIDIRVKAHIVKVPVTAKVLDADEYDRLDNESLNLHGRRIGRHREKADGSGVGPVQVVRDEGYCRAVLGEAFIPLPPDYDDNLPGISGGLLS